MPSDATEYVVRWKALWLNWCRPSLTIATSWSFRVNISPTTTLPSKAVLHNCFARRDFYNEVRRNCFAQTVQGYSFPTERGQKMYLYSQLFRLLDGGLPSVRVCQRYADDRFKTVEMQSSAQGWFRSRPLQRQGWCEMVCLICCTKGA